MEATTRLHRPKRDGARTREKILRSAIEEFAEHGLSGGRIERIVERAGCNIRLLYRYFGSKERLYADVLEQVYVDIRKQEQALDLKTLPPLAAMKRFIDFTIEHFLNNPAFLKLTTYENMLGGETVAASETIARLSTPLIDTIHAILARGQKERVFRRGVDPLQLYVSIVALACHHLNNMHTLSATFRTDLSAPAWRAARAKHVRAMLLAYLTSEIQP